MKTNNIFTIIAFSLLILVSGRCVNINNSSECTIAGNIAGANAKMLILEEITPESRYKIDSTIVETDGRFEFTFLPHQQGIFTINLPNHGFITFYAEKSSRLTLTAEINTWPGKYQISGNKESELLEQYFTKTAFRQSKLDSLSLIFNNNQHHDNFYQIKQELDSSFGQLYKEQQLFTLELIRDNPSGISTLLLLGQYFGKTLLVNPDENFNLYCILDSNLMALYPGNMHVMSHHNRVLELKTKYDEISKIESLLGKGMLAPEISLPDPTGKIIALSSLKRKKVLLFFWASWSPPCRAAIQQLKDFYQQKDTSDFLVYAISFDHVKKYWEAAINIEQTPWLNVSDLRGQHSPVKKLFNIPEALPFYYLIDNEGRIIEKSTRLSEILKIER